MGKTLYSHFEWISYIICGIVILLSIDLAFDGFGAHIVASSKILNASGMKAGLVLAASYVLGQANSHVAHWILQEFVTVVTLGRPSHWLLFGRPDHPIKYFRALDEKDISQIKLNIEDALTEDPFDESKKNDRAVFAEAFKRSQRDDGFNEAHLKLLDAFNFSRNMTMALIVSLVFLLIHLGRYAEPANRLKPQLYGEIETVMWVACVVLLLLFLRYVHFLHTYSKHVLLEYARGS